MRELSKRLIYWLPPVIWGLVIGSFSSSRFSSSWSMAVLREILAFFHVSVSPSGWIRLNALVRTAAHLGEYALFTLLLFWAWRAGREEKWRWSWAAGSVLTALLLAAADEIHQSQVALRDGSIVQFGLDFVGAIAALSVLRTVQILRRGRGMRDEGQTDRAGQ